MQPDRASTQTEDWLTQFLCPIIDDNFCFHEALFDLSRLRLDPKSTFEIIHSNAQPKVCLSKKELKKLEKVDPHHTIINHVHNLLSIFRRSAFEYFRVRIEFIDHDQCMLFHTDNVKLRLVQTLWGRSTEVVESKYANYDGIGKGRNELIATDSKNIKIVPKNHFILMKGSRWSSEFKGCIHKSPEIEIHNECRLLVVIDFDDQPLRDYSGTCNV